MTAWRIFGRDVARRPESRMESARLPYSTIGHSTRPIDDFLQLLADVEIALVIDVRTVPRSRANPQYGKEALFEALSGAGVDYEHIAALGGLRKRARATPPEANAFWRNESFHNYADYALGDDFHAGLGRLREMGQAKRCAIMCAEAVWWRCHRRIIADYLLAAGETVFHILGQGHVEKASMTGAAVRGPTGRLTYPLRA